MHDTYCRWLLALARNGDFAWKASRMYTRSSFMGEIWRGFGPEAGAFSGLVVHDEKRVVIQAKHDGGKFNLACTWLESRSQCSVQPVHRFRDSHEGWERRLDANPQGMYIGAPVLNKFQFKGGWIGGRICITSNPPSVAINELLIPPSACWTTDPLVETWSTPSVPAHLPLNRILDTPNRFRIPLYEEYRTCDERDKRRKLKGPRDNVFASIPL